MNEFFDFSLEPGMELKKIKYDNYKKVISVITPAWNPKEYLLQTANCILNQTFPYFEWIIVDDGSTDKESLKLLEKVEKMDERIKVYHKKNEGLSKTRDYGVAKSSKDVEYIVFIDDDDLLDKTYLEISYFSMCANPSASWCYCDVVNFGGQQSLWNKMFSCEKMKRENLLVSQAMIKKNAFYDVGGFSIGENGHYEDWIFWLKLMQKGYFPIHLSYYGFWYRRKTESGQLDLATSMHRRNMKEVKKYASKIKQNVAPIEFPRQNYNWDYIPEINENFVVTKYSVDKKIKILVIVPWMTVGGADKFNVDLFDMIDKEKYSIYLVTCQPTPYIWRQKFEKSCEAVYDLSTFIDRKDWLSFINYIIESRKIDIIFNTNSVTGYMMLPYLHAKYPKIPILDYIHMEEWYNRNGGYSRDSAMVGTVIDKTLLCNKNSEKILVDFFGRKKESVDTVYIGVDANRFDPSKYDRKQLREKYEISDSNFVISMIARIDYQKRPVLLMKIIKRIVEKNVIPNLLFVIAGDGPLLCHIKDIASHDKLEDYIVFLGNTKTPDEIYAISDITINCSIKEGVALTSYESLSMGVPVVSSDVGGQAELIVSDVGVTVPCLQSENEIRDFEYTDEEIDNYVDALIKVYSNIDKYKSKCRKHILNNFTIQQMVKNMEKEFDALYKISKTDDEQLINYSKIFIELLTQYYLGDASLYQWLCSEYNFKVYGYREKSDFGLKRKIKDWMALKFWKFKIYRVLVRAFKMFKKIGDK